MSNRLVLLSSLSLVTSCGGVSLKLVEELTKESLTTAIRQASDEKRLAGRIYDEHKEATAVLVDIIVAADATRELYLNFDFDLRSLATGDEVIAPTQRGGNLVWDRYRATIVPVDPPDGDYDKFDVGHAGTLGDTESPD